MTGTIVYLDICTLKRPFDDPRSELLRRAHERREQMRVEVVRPDQIALDEEIGE